MRLKGEDYGMRAMKRGTYNSSTNNIEINFDDFVDHIVALIDMSQQGFLDRPDLFDHRSIISSIIDKDVVETAWNKAIDIWKRKEGEITDSVKVKDAKAFRKTYMRLGDFLSWYCGEEVQVVTEDLIKELGWEYLCKTPNGAFSIEELVDTFNQNIDEKIDFFEENIGNCIAIHWYMGRSGAAMYEVDALDWIPETNAINDSAKIKDNAEELDVWAIGDNYGIDLDVVTEDQLGMDRSYHTLLKNVRDAERFNYHSDYWGSAEGYQDTAISIMEELKPYVGRYVTIPYDDMEEGQENKPVKVLGLLIDKQYNSHLKVLIEE